MVDKIRKDKLEILPAILVEHYARAVREEWPRLRSIIEDASVGNTIEFTHTTRLVIEVEVVGVVDDGTGEPPRLGEAEGKTGEEGSET